MNFRRSVIVLVLAFFLLDIFLVTTYVRMQENITISQNTNINIQEQMRADGITFASLSSNVETLEVVQVKHSNIEEKLDDLENQQYQYNNGVLSSTLLIPIPLAIGISVTNETFSPLNEFIETNVINGKEYSFFTYNSATKKVVYTQKVNEWSIADGSSQLVFTLNANNEIISYEQTFAGEGMPIGESRNLITAQYAVEQLYLNNKIPNKSTITNIRLMYYKILTLTDIDIYHPAWYVELLLPDGQMVVRRIDGIRGTILTNESIDAVSVTN